MTKLFGQDQDQEIRWDFKTLGIQSMVHNYRNFLPQKENKQHTFLGTITYYSAKNKTRRERGKNKMNTKQAEAEVVPSSSLVEMEVEV